MQTRPNMYRCAVSHKENSFRAYTTAHMQMYIHIDTQTTNMSIDAALPPTLATTIDGGISADGEQCMS